MAEGLSASVSLAEAVQDLARGVVSALQSGDGPSGSSPSVLPQAEEAVSLAAVRVVGADVLAPRTLLERPPAESDVRCADAAVRAFPADSASVTSCWGQWGTRAALSLAGAGPLPEEPGISWAHAASWQYLSHQFSVLSALAGLPVPSALGEVASLRAEDLARGFVRAVRRRDWRQASGTGRWLITLGSAVPATLGLEQGLALVAHLGGADAQVGLQIEAARTLAARAVRTAR